jgi:Fic family protein
MSTLEQLSQGVASIPASSVWYLTYLAEAKGRQELYTKQSPQRLKRLLEHALIESAVSSNRLEGVQIDKSRIGTVIFGTPLLRDRDEEEVAGYRDALRWVHAQGRDIPITQETIRELHRMSRGRIWDAGQYKERDGDIIERYPDGRQRVRFRTVPAAETAAAMASLVELWGRCLKEEWVHPLIGLAAFNLDFLCIHPFRDGNGRVSRLLLLLQLYHLGYEVGRYISLERLIESTKEQYYETLEQSSQDWHQGRADLWPFANYLLSLLKSACREFEERLGQLASPRGEKTELVRDAILHQRSEFRLLDIERACPGVSREWIRTQLGKLSQEGAVVCKGRGPAARWKVIRSKGTTST